MEDVSCETQSSPSISGESQAPCEVWKTSTSCSKYKEDYSLLMAEGMHIHQTAVKDNEESLLKHRVLEEQIRDVLEAKDITASTPIRLKNCLYNVISALEDCVVLSEKRESRQKKDGPMHGYTVAEHWLLCKTRRLLMQIKRKLRATADAIIPGMADMATSSSSTFLPLIPRPNSLNFDYSDFPGFHEQLDTILDRLGNGEGFQEIGIVGIGGSSKTTLAQMVFAYQSNRRVYIEGIAILRMEKNDTRKE
ncbi:hypothetical protein CK203_027786 [Vitis vinifera]|uniref:NB-ARC domain-containing protein n=1 Tax=Vitis vinifera TaxID=29760 RepID=A0A438J3I4_VITVI|nr:hypothetical protein CK203_027786 [Vitis vinifera]